MKYPVIENGMIQSPVSTETVIRCAHYVEKNFEDVHFIDLPDVIAAALVFRIRKHKIHGITPNNDKVKEAIEAICSDVLSRSNILLEMSK